MTKNPVTIGIYLLIITLIIFFATYYFFYGVHYFDISIKVISFLLPLLYCAAAFWSVYSNWKSAKSIDFRTAFRRAFVPMFIGGFFSFFSIFIFLNFIDTDAKNLLNYQYLERQKKELDTEYYKAKKILKHEQDQQELDQKYKERLQSFELQKSKGKDMLTFSHFAAYFAAILLFYMIISLFFGAFFRSRSAR